MSCYHVGHEQVGKWARQRLNSKGQGDSVGLFFKEWIRACLISSTDLSVWEAVWGKIQTPTRMDDDTWGHLVSEEMAQRHCWHSILRHFTLDLIRRDPGTQGQRQKRETQGERQRFTFGGLSHRPQSHSLNVSVSGMKKINSKATVRQLLLILGKMKFVIRQENFYAWKPPSMYTLTNVL